MFREKLVYYIYREKFNDARTWAELVEIREKFSHTSSYEADISSLGTPQLNSSGPKTKTSILKS